MSQDGDELALAIEYSHVLVNGAQPFFLENGCLPNARMHTYAYHRLV